MIREGFFSRCPTIRVSLAEYERIPIGQPEFLSEAEIGHRWKEICWGGVRIRTFLGMSHDGPLISTVRPVIRVRAISRHVPRQQVVA